MAQHRSTPTRIRIAAGLTGAVVAVLAVVFVVTLGDDSEEAATTTAVTTTSGVPLPPPLFETDPSWNIRGHSRFADAERSKREPGGRGPLVEGVENVPPARLNITTTTIEQRVISLEESGALTTRTTSGPSVTTSGVGSSSGGTGT